MVDISVNDSEFDNVYPNAYGYNENKLFTIDENNVNSSYIHKDIHFGTHVDAPLHWIKNGKNVSNIDNNLFHGEVQVLTINNFKNDIDKITHDRVIFRANSHLDIYKPFDKDFNGIDYNIANSLIDKNIKVVGIDYLSIEKFNSDGNAHIKLLENEVLIYESLYLKNIKDGIYQYYGFPILNNLEASSVRVFIN